MAKKVTKKATKKTGAVETRKPRRRAEVKASAKAATRVETNGTLTQERIRERAYEIYRAGRNPSDPTADWYQAEQELRTELGA